MLLLKLQLSYTDVIKPIYTHTHTYAHVYIVILGRFLIYIVNLLLKIFTLLIYSTYKSLYFRLVYYKVKTFILF